MKLAGSEKPDQFDAFILGIFCRNEVRKLIEFRGAVTWRFETDNSVWPEGLDLWLRFSGLKLTYRKSTPAEWTAGVLFVALVQLNKGTNGGMLQTLKGFHIHFHNFRVSTGIKGYPVCMGE